ncbi:MAG TPA: alpha/beta fold hydrolase [Candidatus Angelobacter sp.]|jgi:pimeloyl-ACP methyl ester carboxylesterase|nr:alpha/beta fold hydrolase [Candidatus Angelobacter sp.]
MAAVHWPEGSQADERRHALRIAGTRTNVVEMGAGEPLILLHGFGDSLATWRYTMPALARHHHVIAADLPGFGRSHPSTHRPLLDWYAHWTEELIARVAPRGRATLIGNSLGAAIALDTALRTPLRVSKLVLVDCAGLGTGVPLWWRLVTAQLFRLPPLSEPAARVLPQPVLERIVAEIYSTLVFHRPASIDPACARDFAAHHGSPAHVNRLHDLGHDVVRELASGRLMREAGTLHVPTLILWGRQDRLIPAAHGTALQRRIQNAQLYLFDDCGHCPQLERPAEFSATVERFLRAGRAATSARVVGAEQLGA